jgi:hypothetical protein
MNVDTGADLYALPLEAFTEARNELAERLKATGDTDEAKRVRALKKPSMSAWAVNQLARTEPGGIEQLFGLRDQIEAASSAPELRSLTEERRKLLSSLVGKARALLIEGGHAPAASTIDKVQQTLLTVDEDARDDLVAGTLERELEASTASFGAFGSFDASTVTFSEEDDEPDPHLERLRAEADEAERVASELEAAALEAEAAADAARDRATEARRTAARAREKATKAES